MGGGGDTWLFTCFMTGVSIPSVKIFILCAYLLSNSSKYFILTKYVQYIRTKYICNQISGNGRTLQ